MVYFAFFFGRILLNFHTWKMKGEHHLGDPVLGCFHPRTPGIFMEFDQLTHRFFPNVSFHRKLHATYKMLSSWEYQSTRQCHPPPRNKVWIVVVNNPLFRPNFLGESWHLGRVLLDSHDIYPKSPEPPNHKQRDQQTAALADQLVNHPACGRVSIDGQNWLFHTGYKSRYCWIIIPVDTKKRIYVPGSINSLYWGWSSHR